MATSTPWQVANAGQWLPTVRTTRVIFSHGTTPWPYAPHYEVDTVDPNAATPNGVYGANGPTNGSGNGGTGGTGGSGNGGAGSGGSGNGGSGSGGSGGCGCGGNCGLPAGQGGGAAPG